MLRRYNKRAQSIPIAVLVLITLSISIYIMFIFYTATNPISAKIKDSRFLDEIYIKENEINFYVQNAFDKSSGNEESFKSELLRYKINGEYIIPELVQVEEQINSNNLILTNNPVLKIRIKIDRDFEEKVIASYVYEKEFVKN